MLGQAKKTLNENRGFTIIELMIAMAIAGLVFAAIYKIFTVQQGHYTAQLDVTELQQNIRGGLNMMARDFRMAGYDGVGVDQAKIINARPDLFHFTVDLNEDGDVSDDGENIAYDHYYSGTYKTWVLGRATAANEIKIHEPTAGHWEVDGTAPNPRHQPAATDIEHLEFRYLDKNGDSTTVVEEIRSVEITLIAKASNPDPKFTNNQTYTTPSLTSWTKSDNFRRRMQTLTIQCRNIGI